MLHLCQLFPIETAGHEMNCSHRDSDYLWQYQHKHAMGCNADTSEDITHAIIKLQQTLDSLKDAHPGECKGIAYFTNYNKKSIWLSLSNMNMYESCTA